jgi:hypothetical protein
MIEVIKNLKPGQRLQAFIFAAVLSSGTAILTSYMKIRGFFCPRQHLLSAEGYRKIMQDRFDIWNKITNKIIFA